MTPGISPGNSPICFPSAMPLYCRACRRAGTPAGVFGAELRFYRTRAGLSQKDLAARTNVSHDVISTIETGDRPPAEDFPPRLDAVPELDTRGALTRLWDHLKKGHKQRLSGWFQQWADTEAQAHGPALVGAARRPRPAADRRVCPRDPQRPPRREPRRPGRAGSRPSGPAGNFGPNGCPQLWCILDEGVLHRAIGDRKVMRSRLCADRGELSS